MSLAAECVSIPSLFIPTKIQELQAVDSRLQFVDGGARDEPLTPNDAADRGTCNGGVHDLLRGNKQLPYGHAEYIGNILKP